MDIVIEKTHDSYQGHSEYISITIENSLLEMGGFDFLIQYDPTALQLQTATIGQLPEDCEWEYFTYRHGPNGNCGPGACPTGIVRIVAIAEMNDGFHHPTCFGPPDIDPYELAELKFLVTNDRTFECMYIPINWIWYDCGDNAVSSVTGDTLFISRYVHAFEGMHIEDGSEDFPTIYGAPDICLDNDPDKPLPIRLIDFWNGGVDIICADSIDLRGDINLNNVANEIADAVVFSNYFVYGVGVFTVNPEGQIAASDVNADGIALSVADLVYQIRIIVGDADPYPKVVTPVEVSYVHMDDGVMSVDGAQIGAAFVTARGKVTPELLADGMDILYHFDEATNSTKILVYSLAGNSFTDQFLRLDGEVVSLEMATRAGNPVNAKQRPNKFALNQNYPNPFNPTTMISFTLQTASDYTLTIYNVSGQTVAQFADRAPAGTVSIEWNATDLASGIYFYNLQAGNFTDTKKMILLK
jgi:hypothetical protein